MAFSIRLDADTEQALTRLARRRRQTKAAVVREALAVFDREQTASHAGPQTPFEAFSPFIGIVRSGGEARRSENTGEGFRALLKEKARGRRAR